MSTRQFALVFGVVYGLVGLLGLIPNFLSPLDPPDGGLAVDTLYGNLLGLFPVNILHTLVHLVIGAWGIAAYRSWAHARTFARSVAVIFGVLTIFGLIPGLNTFFGLIPLFGTDVLLHALTTVVAAYFGWMHRDRDFAEAVHDRDISVTRR